MILNGTEVKLKLNGEYLPRQVKLNIIKKELTQIKVSGFIVLDSNKSLTDSDSLRNYFSLFEKDMSGEVYYKDIFIIKKKVKLTQVDFSFNCEESGYYELTLDEL